MRNTDILCEGCRGVNQHIAVSHLKQLEVSLPADLRLTEAEVQTVME